MIRANVLIGLGILVVLAPFSGLPLAWLQWLLPIIGIIIILIGAMIRRAVIAHMMRMQGLSSNASASSNSTNI